MAEPAARITVLDDHAQTLDLMREVLEADGYVVSVTKSVGPELHEIRDTFPNLVVIDLLLATDQRLLSGWDVARLVRSHADLYGVPILVISADHGRLRSVEKEAQRMHDVHLLAKPFGLDQLRAVVRNALQSSPARMAVAATAADTAGAARADDESVVSA